MQPNLKMKKTLLASALMIGLGNAFTASGDVFTVSAGAVPDVTAAPVTGYTELSFGQGIIGNKVGESCSMNGVTGMAESVLLYDINEDGNLNTANLFGLLSGNACVTGNNEVGTPMVIEIDGSDSATVSITVADVTGTGWTYTPTAESCVVDFTGDATNAGDACTSLAGNTVTGIAMSATQVDGTGGSTEVNAAQYGFAAMTGKTRMVLAGSVTIDSEIAAGTVVNENIIVQVTYE